MKESYQKEMWTGQDRTVSAAQVNFRKGQVSKVRYFVTKDWDSIIITKFT